ncbi:hypothetical protein SELMODRAFT_236869 [Selaginella moellendorffii]|uniref:Smr domain-containing protein n=2 Tax=Selaginella moellendorffii TaxID=88036 RepID=D8TEB9_SELML|nr:hypothetical protein SELMODRAFT_236869 [Selaginella moellendorffii]
MDVEAEALGLLEWPLVCRQIARFCATPMGVAAARGSNLPVGKNREDSEGLQDQTADAHKLAGTLRFLGAKDVTKVVEAAISGEFCNVGELCSVKDTLECARRLHDQLFAKGGGGLELERLELSPLQRIMQGLELCSELREDIDKCLDSKREIVLDRASTKLSQVRRQRQANMTELDILLKETARMVIDAGGIDSMTITTRRARLCVAVRASHKFLLPGGVVLDSSNTGATLFMEPEPALRLNNLEIQLSAAERAEEVAICRRLASRVAASAASILEQLNAIMLLDLACARAKHAKWLGAVKPAFFESKSESKGVIIEEIRHPLLLETALEKGLDRDNFPVPIDIKVRDGVKIVIISGPNTGGKTVALKTLGIASIMAKAGLYLPASGNPRLPWFDRIFADVGDSQSLEQNLSTFSGHMRRLCKITEASGPQSLVLIDEIGGGTDPAEGSSLATAVLKYFAKTVHLCIVTTHSASLKTLPIHDQDLPFENASVEFDLETLRPTYRVLWGLPGQSNAVNIAKSLQFDSDILSRASYWLTKLTPSGLKSRQSDLMLQLMKQSEEEEDHACTAAVYLSDIETLHNEIAFEVDDLDKRKIAAKRQELASMSKHVTEAKNKMEAVISRYKEGLSNNSGGGKAFTLRTAQDSITTIVNDYGAFFKEQNPSNSYLPLPGVGERVIIRRLGKKPATVLEPADDSGHLMVQLGTMKMRVKTTELMLTAQGSPVKQAKKPAPFLPESGTTELKFGPAIQTSKNTVDLRGMTVEDAIQVVRMVIAEREPGSVLFIIHGVGTGALKQAVISILRKHPNVAKFEDESFVNGGCTVAYVS